MGKAIFAVIGLLAAGAIFLLYTKPTYDGVGVIRAEIAEYDAALAKSAELQQVKQALLSKFNAFSEEEKERLRKLLPDHVDNVRLILDLDSIASKHNMALQNVVVSTAATEEQSSSAIGAISSSRQEYDSLTTKFTTQGDYKSFLQFMLDLEQSLRIVDLVSLRLAPASTASKGGEPVYSFDVTVRTYWLK